MLYLNTVTRKIQHHSTASFIVGEDHVMEKPVLGLNGFHSSNAMVMSRVSSVYQ